MDGRRPQTRQSADELLDQVVERLASELAPRRIYLFGSHAYGTPSEDSDIDVMIVVGSADSLSIDFLKRAHACLRGTFLPFELHFRSIEKFDHRSSIHTSLEYDIITRGRLLYAA